VEPPQLAVCDDQLPTLAGFLPISRILFSTSFAICLMVKLAGLAWRILDEGIESVISAGVGECAAFSLAPRKDEGRSVQPRVGPSCFFPTHTGALMSAHEPPCRVGQNVRWRTIPALTNEMVRHASHSSLVGNPPSGVFGTLFLPRGSVLFH
jgi:hypothetical protein